MIPESAMTLQARKLLIHRQRGVAQLLVTVVLLIVVMMLGITAMILSTTQFNLAANLQRENIAFNRAEGSSATAESWLSDAAGTNPINAGFTTYSGATPYLYPMGYLAANNIDPLTMTWTDSNSFAVNGHDTRRYLIEKIGANNFVPSGDVAQTHGLHGCQNADLFRITSRGTSAKGTTKLIQSAFMVPRC